MSVVGESRDAAFVAAADFDDRVKKTQLRAWPYIVSRPWFFAISMMLAMNLAVTSLTYFSNSRSAADHLQEAYDSGSVKDSIQAMIALERFKSSSPWYQIVLVFLLPFGIMWAILLFAQHIVPKVFLSYVFYWGDAVTTYDKRKSTFKVFWTVIVLGLLVSVIAGWVVTVLAR